MCITMKLCDCYVGVRRHVRNHECHVIVVMNVYVCAVLLSLVCRHVHTHGFSSAWLKTIVACTSTCNAAFNQKFAWTRSTTMVGSLGTGRLVDNSLPRFIRPGTF